ncbi:MAG: glycosyltransferase family 2 protein [Parcubacteria group bacterium]|nr:glycosyltransferase family 2 protein [Parcubacteria group bacterium]
MNPTKISIIIAIYNSHGAVARQVKHFKAMNLPDDIEFIFMDDGSNPPHKIEDYELSNLRIHYTNDKRPWTQGLARNAGAKLAKGEYLFFTDIDHIISKEAIEAVYEFTGDKMVFPRHFGVLLEDGVLSQEPSVLEEYGMDMGRLKTERGLYASVHGNTYAIKKTTFERIGGYSARYCTYGHHAPSRGGEDGHFNHLWNRYAKANGIQSIWGPKIYIFPIGQYHVRGDLNPKGLFHNLSHDQAPQPLKE